MTADAVRYAEVLHKRHGWIAAPEGGWFEVSASGKSVELHETVYVEGGFAYPFGTRFNMTSVLAFGNEVMT